MERFRIPISVVLISMTASCGQGPDEAKKYRILAKTGTMQEKCDEAGRVARAYLDDKNENEFGKWREVEKNDCLIARLDSYAARR